MTLLYLILRLIIGLPLGLIFAAFYGLWSAGVFVVSLVGWVANGES